MSWTTLSLIFEYLKTNWWIGVGVAGVALVVGWKMTASWANIIVALSWAIFIFAIYRAPLISEQPAIPRVLWTILCSSGLGLLFYYTIWTPKVESKVESVDLSKAVEISAFILPANYPANTMMGKIPWNEHFVDVV